MKGPRIEFSREVEQVYLKNGEYITIYFKMPHNKYIQVELRKTEKAGAEIFFDSAEVKIKSFDDWHDIKEE